MPESYVWLFLSTVVLAAAFWPVRMGVGFESRGRLSFLFENASQLGKRLVPDVEVTTHAVWSCFEKPEWTTSRNELNSESEWKMFPGRNPICYAEEHMRKKKFDCNFAIYWLSDLSMSKLLTSNARETLFPIERQKTIQTTMWNYEASNCTKHSRSLVIHCWM